MTARRPDTFYVRTFGCQMNEHDSERIAGVLEALGMTAVTEADDADLLVYNTCSIREKADTRLAGHLGEARRLKGKHPDRLVVVAGCLAQSRKSAFFDEFPFVDVLVGPQSLHELPLLLDERLHGGRRVGAFEDTTSRWSADLPRARAEGPLAWVQIMTGCTNYCSYCIVPYVRGPEASRDADDVEREVRGLVGAGVREVTLLGQNVNAYGADGAAAGGGPRGSRVDFPALLERLSAIEGLARIRFMTSHPKDVSPGLVRAMAELAPVCEHLHLPVQSGSDRVLRAMRRGYGRSEYLALVETLRGSVADLSLTTDLIVGFPGETEEEFEETLALVDEVGFDAAFTFIYSPRAQTAAAGLPGRIPHDVAEARMARLVDAVRRSARARNEALLGSVVEVLIEGGSRHDPREASGRTRTFKMVNVTAGEGAGGATGAGVPRAGDLVRVRVTAASSASLRGELVSGERSVGGAAFDSSEVSSGPHSGVARPVVAA